MNQRKLFSILIALTLILITIPIRVEAPIDYWVESEVDEDCFWATYQFDDVDFNYLQGDNMRIIGWYRFEAPDVLEWGKPIQEAYLSVMTMGGYEADPDASMTLYGQPAREGGAQSIYDDMDQRNGPYTSSYVNVDLSSFVGNHVWHNITVTNIIREINQGWYFDDGHDVAFITLSTDNHDAERTIASEETGYAAKLYVHYKTPEPEDPEYPPDLPDEVEWIEDYRNYTIWLVDPPGAFGYDQMEYVFTEGTGAPYDLMYDDLDGVGPFKIMDTNNAYASGWGWQRKLVRMSDETLYVVYSDGQLYVKQSADNGTTWTNETRISTGPGMDGWDQYDACMAVDSDDYLHVVFVGANATLVEQIYYVNYTSSWSTPIRISTFAGMADGYLQGPVIAVDSNDYLHVVFYWYGYDPGDEYLYQVWYTKNTESWTTPIRISTGMQDYFQAIVSIAVESNDHLHVVWEGEGIGFANRQIWYNTYTDSWAIPVRISVYSDMEDYEQYQPVIVLDSSDNLHVVWYGEASGFTTGTQIWYRKYTGSWGAVTRISTYTGMEGYEQGSPNPHAGGLTLASDSDDYIHALWGGKATGLSDQQKIWLGTYTDSWATPVCLQPNGRNRGPNLRWSNFPVLAPDDYYIVTDPNGTIVETWNGENCTTLDCIKDEIDDDIGYPDPEDPDPPGWEDEVLTAHRFKLILFMIGMIMFVGSPVYGFAARPEAATWITIMMCMLVGVALLWSLQTM